MSKVVSAQMIDVLIPTAISDSVRVVEMASRLDDLSGKVLGLLDNGKICVGEVFPRIESQLSQKYNLTAIVRQAKSFAGDPAGESIINELVAKCDAVLVGIGD